MSIVTLTVNPALDLATKAKSVQPGHKIRTFDERYDPGGGGINVARVFTVTFVIGAMLGALGGAFTAPMISVVPGIGVEVIVLAFAVVVVGGLGSIEGAAIGALMVGIGRTLAVNVMPEVELFIVYGVMALVLIVRPQGLFGRAEARKI